LLTFLTAGESHGRALVAIIDGLPANLSVDLDFINNQLARRQLGMGRGGRMKIESDQVSLLSGVRGSITIGSPVALLIENKDWVNWQQKMDPVKADTGDTLTTPRPGHADLAGSLKTGLTDLRNILERASARQTASLVGAGAFAKLLLKEFGIEVISQVTAIGSVNAKPKIIRAQMLKDIDASPVRTADKEAERPMIQAIEDAQKSGDTLGGSFEVVATGVISGLGSYSVADKRLDGRLCQALVGIPAVKAASVGQILETAFMRGSEAHDEIHYEDDKGYFRKTNKAGGIEGGVSNGSDIVLNGFMKPIPTLSKPLNTVDMQSKEAALAFKERHDTVAVPAAAVIGEAAVALELADAFMEKFGSDNLDDIKQNYQNYLNRIKSM